jgi:hypothetical protein
MWRWLPEPGALEAVQFPTDSPPFAGGSYSRKEQRAMAEPKTKRTTASVEGFIASLESEKRRADCTALAAMMKKATRQAPWMYGSAIIGYGTYPYVSGGKTLEAPRAAFSPRKQYLVVYLMPDFAETDKDLLARLGKHKTAKVCLYINSLEDVDRKVLQQLIDRSVAAMDEKYPR